jgi:hypothetical protein
MVGELLAFSPRTKESGFFEFRTFRKILSERTESRRFAPISGSVPANGLKQILADVP